MWTEVEHLTGQVSEPGIVAQEETPRNVLNTSKLRYNIVDTNLAIITLELIVSLNNITAICRGRSV